MNMRSTFITSCVCFLIGFGTYAYFNNWVVIQFPFRAVQDNTVKAITTGTHKKRCLLYYWHDNRWKTEPLDLMWTEPMMSNCMYLLNSWFNFLDEERIMDRKVLVQTAIVAAQGKELYVSFDRSPFNPQSTLFEKWMLIEGLLKTMRENNIVIAGVWFLEHHQTLHDNHVDFTNAWPIGGFIKK